jgi:hypothetical protein
MFGSALLVSFVARRFDVAGVGDAEPSFLASSYLAAMRVSLMVGFPAFVIAFFGLLRFQRWARKLFTLLILAWGLQILVFGVFNLSLTWGLSDLFADLALLTAGVVLAMSYMTPIDGLFRQTSRNVPSSDGAELSPVSP